MSFTISKEFRFEAAHSLPHLPASHKCSRVHGHSYVLVVHCSGPLKDGYAWVVDYADISKVVEPVVSMLDHRNLNEVIPGHTTAETLAWWVFDMLKDDLPTLCAVEIRETATTSVIYRE